MALSSLAEACVPSTFTPTLPGAEILSIEASMVKNYNFDIPDALVFANPPVNVENANFCNVTVTYTHSGHNEEAHVEAWLPVDNWNGRFQAVGGGGWVTGRFVFSYATMARAIYDGYATITTDAGLGTELIPNSWALQNSGDVNLHKLEDFASTSLNDEAIIGKSLIKSFYGQPPSFSYWLGCSSGGRQGIMLGQRYPTAYDGIAAGAPAIHFTETVLNTFWAEHVMTRDGHIPYGCEIDAISAAAVSKCTGSDGFVLEVEECLNQFSPFDLVGTSTTCAETKTTVAISEAAAKVAKAAWEGIISSSGERLWPGLSIDTDLTGNYPVVRNQRYVASTDCSGERCVPVGNFFGKSWVSLFLAKDPNFNTSNITPEQFENFFHTSKQQYDSITGTNDPDLSEFKKTGKMLVWHGLADNLISPKGTEKYSRDVTKRVDNAEEFYRYYPVPGLAHCMGGYGGRPYSLFEQLRTWVENGTAPESLPVSFSDRHGVIQNRVVCPWPQKAEFDSDCGDVTKAECWSCPGRGTNEEPKAEEKESNLRGNKHEEL
ncbi:tannase and feruloyl esterase [Hypoxylon trugodes]|uniref:tannase and feruloyl esterase n=1 Tax=Hypoxylon trugodes TaxID=326681 RepID=UPI0021A024FB|nr:tannase and feruloyl esterase [Hypoxylon trugodes]KAI1391701.1 tannase and feruloyl esterase [Hypoxylon trugodes]